MAAHKTNSLLKYGIIIVVGLIIIVVFLGHHSDHDDKKDPYFSQKTIHNTAASDSAAESLDTLTAELASTKQQVSQITKDNAVLKNQNAQLLTKLQGLEDATTQSLQQEIEQLKTKFTESKNNDYIVNNAHAAQPITIVPDLAQPTKTKNSNPFNVLNTGTTAANSSINTNNDYHKPKSIPYYTIPANSTGVHDRLMTALVGRIPIKGVVTDPYPFKLVFSDDTLAANGLRVPHLRQMVVSGYTEGDLNLVSVRGWVTSLTFVFDDGTISTTTSNNNDIGHFTKNNALGYLSDQYGNPFIRGRLITNAPAYLSGNILLGAAQGAAGAYAQEQTTNQTSILGSTTSTVTGSPSKYVLGQAGVNAASQAQQWWQDREQNSFDAIYVPTVDKNGRPIEISVNFAKEITIDYNPTGRKLNYANVLHTDVSRRLD